MNNTTHKYFLRSSTTTPYDNITTNTNNFINNSQPHHSTIQHNPSDSPHSHSSDRLVHTNTITPTTTMEGDDIEQVNNNNEGITKNLQPHNPPTDNDGHTSSDTKPKERDEHLDSFDLLGNASQHHLISGIGRGRTDPSSSHQRHRPGSPSTFPMHTHTPHSPDTNFLNTLSQLVSTLHSQTRQGNDANPLRGHKITPFDGGSSSDFEDWRNHVSSIFNYLNWTGEQMANYIPIILTKRAKQYYDELPLHTRCSIDHTMEALEKQFSAKHKPLMIRQKMLQKSQKPGESVSDYTENIMETFRKLNITDQEQKLAIYVQNLAPHIQKHVQMALPTSLQHAQNLAEAAEHADKLEGQNNIEIITTMFKQLESKLDKQKETETHKTELLQANSYHRRGFHHGPRRGRGAQHSFNSPHFRHTPNQRYMRGTFRGRLMPRSQPPPRSPYCTGCQTRHPHGHHLAYFPQPNHNRNVNNIMAPTCYGCGQQGHIARNCPYQ